MTAPAPTSPATDGGPLPVDPLAHVRSMLDGWTPPGPDPSEEAEAVRELRPALGDDFDVDALRALRIDYGAPANDDEARDALAGQIVTDLHELATMPGRRNWRRWRLTFRAALFLYVSGITYDGGSVSWSPLDPWGAQYELPKLSHVRRTEYGRPYVLWMSREVRACLRTQLAYARHGHQPPAGWHRPGSADVHGLCGRCMPWHCCGSTDHGHADDCPEQAGVS